MNMNLDIVNRALYSAGHKILKGVPAENDEKEFEIYQLCKSFYLSTFLEALSEVEWVGGRKRDKLARTGMPFLKNQKFMFAYDMPFDCAKPVELQDNEFFIVEGRLILTDVENAQLLYVSNGKVLKQIAAVTMKPGDIPEHEYLSAGPLDTEPDYVLYPGDIQDLPYVGDNGNWRINQKDTGVSSSEDAPFPDDPEPDCDYLDYIALNYEPKFYEYIEKKLAAKFAMKLTDQPQLHQRLLQEALLVKQEAIDASRSSRAAKIKEEKFWGDELGLNS